MFVNSDKTRIFFLLQVRALGEDEKEKRGKKKFLAQNKRLNKKFGNDTKQALFEKKQCAVFQVGFFFRFVFTLVDFLYLCTRCGKKKSIFGYCNWQACTVVYATVKYLLYHLLYCNK